MSMIRRAIMLAFAAIVLFPAVAAASPYSNDTITVSDSSPRPGESVQVVASGFRPNSDVDIFFRSTPVLLESTAADGAGEVATNVVIPSTASGQHEINVVGVAPDGSPRSVSTRVVVDTGGGLNAPADTLPTTGDSTTPTVIIAIVAALVGVALVIGTRVRRRARSA